MDMTRLRLGELIAGIAGLILLLSMFMNWYSIGGDFGGGPAGAFAQKLLDQGEISTSLTAWQAFSWLDLFLFFTGVVAIATAVLQMTQRTVAVPVAASVVTTELGLVATVWVLYRIVDQPGPNDVIGVSFGAYLGLLASGAIALGGYLSMREEGSGFAGSGPDGGIPAQPAPPATAGPPRT